MRASASPRRSARVGAVGWATWSVGSALKEASAFKEASDDDMTCGNGLRPGNAKAFLRPLAPARSMALLCRAGRFGVWVWRNKEERRARRGTFRARRVLC